MDNLLKNVNVAGGIMESDEASPENRQKLSDECFERDGHVEDECQETVEAADTINISIDSENEPNEGSSNDTLQEVISSMGAARSANEHKEEKYSVINTSGNCLMDGIAQESEGNDNSENQHEHIAAVKTNICVWETRPKEDRSDDDGIFLDNQMLHAVISSIIAIRDVNGCNEGKLPEIGTGQPENYLKDDIEQIGVIGDYVSSHKNERLRLLQLLEDTQEEPKHGNDNLQCSGEGFFTTAEETKRLKELDERIKESDERLNELNKIRPELNDTATLNMANDNESDFLQEINERVTRLLETLTNAEENDLVDHTTEHIQMIG